VTWTLVEPCAGTAAFSLFQIGADRQLVPRQGSKWTVRRELSGLAASFGFIGLPSSIVLSDADPWALAIQQVLENRDEVLIWLRLLVEEGEHDPIGLFAALDRGPVPDNRARMAAHLLWLQRMAYNGKAVVVRDGCWVSPGINPTSAQGLPATERFGAVRPLGAALLEVVVDLPRFMHVDAMQGLVGPAFVEDPRTCLVYLDPPYVGTTGYGAELSRADVVRLALEWADAGAAVIVSEAEPVAELVQLGWAAVELAERNARAFRFGDRQEFVTFRAGAVQPQPTLFGPR
jgi:hypothetical protein